MTRKRGKEHSIFQMGKNSLASGSLASSMGLVCITHQMAASVQVSGMRGFACVGKIRAIPEAWKPIKSIGRTTTSALHTVAFFACCTDHSVSKDAPDWKEKLMKK